MYKKSFKNKFKENFDKFFEQTETHNQDKGTNSLENTIDEDQSENIIKNDE